MHEQNLGGPFDPAWIRSVAEVHIAEIRERELREQIGQEFGRDAVQLDVRP